MEIGRHYKSSFSLIPPKSSLLNIYQDTSDVRPALLSQLFNRPHSRWTSALCSKTKAWRLMSPSSPGARIYSPGSFSSDRNGNDGHNSSSHPPVTTRGQLPA